MLHSLMPFTVLLVLHQTAVYALPECFDYKDFSHDICDAMMYGNVLYLEQFYTLGLTTPQDPTDSCNNYKPFMNCSVLVRALDGQRIVVRTGSTYILGNDFCANCESCDSYKVDEMCVRPDLMPNRDVFVTNSSWAAVQFTSRYAHSKSESKAQLSLRAFGCPSSALVKGAGITVAIVDGERLLLDTKTYTAKVTCDGGETIQGTEKKEMFVECKEGPKPSEYYWVRSTEELLSCPDSTAITAVAVTVTIIVVLLVLVILFVLFYLSKLPCQQRDGETLPKVDNESLSPLRKSRRKQKVKADKKDGSRRYDNIEGSSPQQLVESNSNRDSTGRLADVSNNHGIAEASSTHSIAADTGSNYGNQNHSNNGHNEALIAAEVAQYWNVTRNGQRRQH